MTTSAFQEGSHYVSGSVAGSVHGGRPDDTLDETATAGAVRRDDAGSVDHIVEKTPPADALTKRQKVRRHCGRFWLWYLIGSIILLAILLPIL